ncbi:spore germination protein [Halobacillus karajensis]|uniref:Spore germination protein YaaH n=1 Tax=Halobacillus karajensis TaxID=195088 RepID=A0A059NZ20_9BACI|nr:glycoside hydrolase family 18 protein [Halobacillus karajensis]CDQ18362.1 Spore germination protein YaaH [Halobacillus karajensis]CDQ23566.1 Spore germination protein YaaH [Halobacillus karajensis]CDQ27048.1 Spore germination protein YaaH [Halobacillus karajensis]SEH52543.1 spore germination protein [Halobacillus karajensis]
MQIHVVQQGDSVFSIAGLYDSTPNAIIEANELETPGDLVIGQALVIPIVGQFYFVQQGDSLYSIAQEFNTTPQQLAQVNGLQVGAVLPVGLRLYIPDAPPRSITANAYIEPFGGEVSDTLRSSAENRAASLTYLAPFSYEIQEDGSLKAPPLDNFKEIAQQNDTALMMVVTNLAEDGFDRELGRKILTDEALQDTLLDNIIQITRQVGFQDVHFDMEFLPPETKENYNQFLRKAKQRLSAEGLLISTALAPKTSAEQQGAWYEAHDYKTHGEIVDFVVLMTYEWGYSGGPPRAVAPIGPVTEVVDYALTEMPAEKILLGQNLYGYDWTLPYEPGGEFAKAISPQQAIQIARENNVAISYDQEEQAPYFTYTDSSGNEHEVWFEDARSIQKKFDLIKERGLLGISYWKLGLAFPQNWLLLNGQFSIDKK